MSSRQATFFTAAAFAAVTAFGAIADAAPNGNFGTCGAGAGRAVCEWVARCERDGGEPRRLLFSTSMTCCFGGGECRAMPENGAGHVARPGGAVSDADGAKSR